MKFNQFSLICEDFQRFLVGAAVST